MDIQSEIERESAVFAKKIAELVKANIIASLGLNVPVRAAPPPARMEEEEPEPEAELDLVGYLRENPGSNAKDIALAMGVRMETVREQLKEFVAAHKVRRTGEARGTKYFAR